MKQGKKKAARKMKTVKGSTKSTSPMQNQELPVPERQCTVSGLAILPPDGEESWPHDALFIKSPVPIGVFRLYNGPSSSVFALGPNIITPAECCAWIKFGEDCGFEATKHPSGNGIAYRDCGRLVVENEDISWRIFSRIQPFMPLSLTDADGETWNLDSCNGNLRLYKYGLRQRFGRHYDGSVTLDKERRTFFTVLLYLNGDGTEVTGESQGDDLTVSSFTHLRGGATAFYGDTGNAVCSFLPRRGFILIHEHGDRCLLHEGCTVSAGNKYLLRTDVIYRRSGIQIRE